MGSLLAGSHLAAAAPPAADQPRHKILGFTKSFSELSLADSADLVEQVGWDGIDVTIRSGNTHIQPERIADELPQWVALFRSRNKEVTMVTTDVTQITAKEETFLRHLAASGVKKYRLGFYKYKKQDDPLKLVKTVAPMLRDIAALNKDLGLWAGYQNHSGPDFFGGPLWDVMSAIDGTDPLNLGLCFDIAHATVEGGLNWPIQAKLVRPRAGVVYVKDYRWCEAKARAQGRGSNEQVPWNRDATPFGTGIVRKAFFDDLKTSGFAGEFCQHHEYPLGTKAEKIAHYRRDLTKLRDWLTA
jgi:sugar phosphate isomerase/epimerase